MRMYRLSLHSPFRMSLDLPKGVCEVWGVSNSSIELSFAEKNNPSSLKCNTKRPSWMFCETWLLLKCYCLRNWRLILLIKELHKTLKFDWKLRKLIFCIFFFSFPIGIFGMPYPKMTAAGTKFLNLVEWLFNYQLIREISGILQFNP